MKKVLYEWGLWYPTIKNIEEVKNQKLLKKIACGSSAEKIRIRAIKKLEDQNTIIQLAKKTRNVNVRNAAIEKIEDKELLKKIALNPYEDLDCFIRLKIAGKFIRKKILREVIKKELTVDIKAAIEKIEDQGLLKKLALEATIYNGCDRAIEKIKDRKTLKKIAQENSDNIIRLRVAKKLGDKKLFTQITQLILKDKDNISLSYLVEEIEDQKILKQLASLRPRMEMEYREVRTSKSDYISGFHTKDYDSYMEEVGWYDINKNLRDKASNKLAYIKMKSTKAPEE